MNLHSGCMYISRHVPFYKTTFPFSTHKDISQRSLQLFRVRNLPSGLHQGFYDPIVTTHPSSQQVYEKQSPVDQSSSTSSKPPPRSNDLAIGVVPASSLTHTHPMTIRIQDGTRRPKVLFSTHHPIPICFTVALAKQLTEPRSYNQAPKRPEMEEGHSI